MTFSKRLTTAVGRVLAVASLVLIAGAVQASDLKVKNFSIDPVPQKEAGLPVLHMSRSYRVTVTVDNLVPPNPGQFTVRTECHRGAKPNTFVLGETRVGMTPSNGRAIAVYDIFPSSAGAGQCRLFTIVDPAQEVHDTNRKPISNVWALEVRIKP